MCVWWKRMTQTYGPVSSSPRAGLYPVTCEVVLTCKTITMSSCWRPLGSRNKNACLRSPVREQPCATVLRAIATCSGSGQGVVSGMGLGGRKFVPVLFSKFVRCISSLRDCSVFSTKLGLSLLWQFCLPAADHHCPSGHQNWACTPNLCLQILESTL